MDNNAKADEKTNGQTNERTTQPKLKGKHHGSPCHGRNVPNFAES